ncbi:MAG TPA: VTT domain-containing protein [Anaeromyxobacter sp.]
MADRPSPAEDLIGHAHAVRVRVVFGAALLATVLVVAHALSLHERVPVLVEGARAAGPKGVLVHLAAYLVAGLLALPLSPLTVAAGAAYGPLAGAALGIPAATLASCAAFLVARLVARDPAALARGDGRIARATRAVGDGGLRLVLLLRLAPVVPFSVLNFAFGATPTRLSHFALGSLVGTIPSQLGYACFGAVLAWPAGPARNAAEVALVVGAAVVSLAATFGVVALLRRRRAGVGPRTA